MSRLADNKFGAVGFLSVGCTLGALFLSKIVPLTLLSGLIGLVVALVYGVIAAYGVATLYNALPAKSRIAGVRLVFAVGVFTIVPLVCWLIVSR